MRCPELRKPFENEFFAEIRHINILGQVTPNEKTAVNFMICDFRCAVFVKKLHAEVRFLCVDFTKLCKVSVEVILCDEFIAYILCPDICMYIVALFAHNKLLKIGFGAIV